MANAESEDHGNLAMRFAAATFLALIAVLSQPALSQVKGGGAMGPPAMGPIGPAGPAMAPQAPIFTPSIPVFSPGLGMPQSTPSGTGASKGSGTADLTDNGGTGGKGGAFQNDAKGQSVSNTKQIGIGIGTTTTAVDPNEPHSTTELSNQKQLGLGFQVAPTADGPWPVPGVSGQFSGGGNLRLLSSNANGAFKLDIPGPGTFTITLSATQLDRALTAAGKPGQPANALIGLNLPADVQSQVQVRSAMVAGSFGYKWAEHVFTDVPARASAHRDLTITVTVPEGEGFPTINWGDGTTTEISEANAAEDRTGDGRAEIRVAVVRNPVAPLPNRENGIFVFQDGHAKFAGESGVNSTSGNPAGPAEILPAILFPVFAQAKLSVSSTVGGTVDHLVTNDHGVALLGKLPVGPLDLEISGEELKTRLNTAVSPNNPQPQETLIELLVVIAIIAMKTDGQPVILGRTLTATSLPQNLKLKLTVTGDGATSGTWWDGAPLTALFGNGGNGGLGSGDANKLKTQFTDLLISSLKTGEVGVVAGVFKPEQPLPSSASATIKVPGPTDSEGQPGTPAAMKNSCASAGDEFCASGKHIGNDGR